jgi:hypothetical protein
MVIELVHERALWGLVVVQYDVNIVKTTFTTSSVVFGLCFSALFRAAVFGRRPSVRHRIV